MAKAKKTAGQTAPAKQVVATNDYKTLTVQHDKTENVYRVYDEKGKEYTADDSPRQIMMHLAHKAGQVLYFRGKKWRRMKPATTATVTISKTPQTTKASETVVS